MLCKGRNFYRMGVCSMIGLRLALSEAGREDGAEDEGHEVPGNERGEHDVDASEEASLFGAPAVDAEHDSGDLDHHQSGDGGRGEVNGETDQGVAFLNALHQESNRGEEIEQLQIAVVDEDGRQASDPFLGKE